jgi:hypothetical protein
MLPADWNIACRWRLCWIAAWLSHFSTSSYVLHLAGLLFSTDIANQRCAECVFQFSGVPCSAVQDGAMSPLLIVDCIALQAGVEAVLLALLYCCTVVLQHRLSLEACISLRTAQP